ncbi:metal-sensitive transcriptional regulator [Dethiosulfovibrio acidaminovorans]|uniref:Metal-sensitive transcriptional regulator n=2 Tax=Dethiosulfovibrio TaxID=47054 RepID=A0ABS9EL49_9BACT|nr:metal-sensitive transcriptional regulator [Dethiosulfovibrio russensis]MCF4141885.1 metal-sensitive transcriptional regulator [Dethiosulfovibrio marinus]MCF4144039.1 metal-sensitive transcriptional regulator [Dethiosulfovibrio acidaminovorans]
MRDSDRVSSKKGRGSTVTQSLIEQLDDLSPERKAMLNRLRRVEGQLRGIQRMIIEEKDCCDVLLQLSAARKALQNACMEILKNYISICMTDDLSENDVDVKRLQKLIEALVDIAPIK